MVRKKPSVNYLRTKLSAMPLPLVPTALGVVVLTSIYDSLGFPLLHWTALIGACVVALCYLLKMAFHLKGVIANEYANPLVAALYPTLPMLIMMICVFVAQLIPSVWLAAEVVFFVMFGLICLHMVIFFIRFVLCHFSWNAFLPSWYVTSNGIMVSTVAGMPFMPHYLAVVVVVWGIAIYALITPFMLWRLRYRSVNPSNIHAQAIMVQPCSMCLASFTNVFVQPNLIILFLLYAAVLISLIYVISKLPLFFSLPFHPGHAGMTYPMVMAVFAARGCAEALAHSGFTNLAWFAQQIAGFQLIIATTITAVVCVRFLGMFMASLHPHANTESLSRYP